MRDDVANVVRQERRGDQFAGGLRLRRIVTGMLVDATESFVDLSGPWRER